MDGHWAFHQTWNPERGGLDEKHEPIIMPKVDPSEVWVDVPLTRELKGYEPDDLLNRLRPSAIPSRPRDTKRGGVFRTIVRGRSNMVPEVPQRFVAEAARTPRTHTLLYQGCVPEATMNSVYVSGMVMGAQR